MPLVALRRTRGERDRSSPPAQVGADPRLATAWARGLVLNNCLLPLQQRRLVKPDEVETDVPGFVVQAFGVRHGLARRGPIEAHGEGARYPSPRKRGPKGG